MTDIQHVVMLSGGRTSWATGKRVAAEWGTDNLTLLFADTNSEDEDLYRFIREAAENIGGTLVWIDNDGRTIWDAMRERRFLGNTRVDPCSDELKRKPLRAWLEEHCDPDNTIVYLGMDWQEEHRIARAAEHWAPWAVEYPMTEEPLMTSPQVSQWLWDEGIKPPRLYDLGFLHNNCKGGCIKAGAAQFKHLLEVSPDVYKEWEEEERGMRQFLDKDVAILRDRRMEARARSVGVDPDEVVKVGSKFVGPNGEEIPGALPLTLTQLRNRVQGNPDDYDHDDVGSCSCMAPTPEGLEDEDSDA